MTKTRRPTTESDTGHGSHARRRSRLPYYTLLSFLFIVTLFTASASPALAAAVTTVPGTSTLPTLPTLPENTTLPTIPGETTSPTDSMPETPDDDSLNDPDDDTNLITGLLDGALTDTDTAGTVQIMLMLTLLGLMPGLLIMMTSFTRIIIVLSFTRNAMGTQQMPPNQVLIGLALFLTIFVMAPRIAEINEVAYVPYSKGEISTSEALERGMQPLREFMMEETDAADMNLFLNIAGMERPSVPADIPSHVLIPAFITSEIKAAFMIGFLIFIPFIIIDMVVASALMSMGMMMLPPITISLPFKILLFVMVDGWGFIIDILVRSFR